MAWERQEPFPSDAIRTVGKKKAAYLLLLSFANVINTKDLFKRQTCQGILRVSTESPRPGGLVVTLECY